MDVDVCFRTSRRVRRHLRFLLGVVPSRDIHGNPGRANDRRHSKAHDDGDVASAVAKYPRETMAPALLAHLVVYLSGSTQVDAGRTYAGGLTKFEPGEMQRLLVPRPELLPDVTRLESEPANGS